MIFSILSGAIKNAGVFLIVDRGIKLLKYVYPDCEYIIYNRNNSLDKDIEQINSSDALILVGGPVYYYNMYPNGIPLLDDLSKIKIPILNIGLGWYGADDNKITIFNNYKFDTQMSNLLKRMEKDQGLTCRDRFTYQVLKNNGFKKIFITGCPAWYFINKINNTTIEGNILNKETKKNICISDFANPKNYKIAIDIIRYIKDKFPNDNIVYVFHRGIYAEDDVNNIYTKEHKIIINELKHLNISYVDISDGEKGFEIYNKCDLHIGMRVHAHIYCLSIRKPSILIEEDGRGGGVNEILGLCRIKAYSNNQDHILKKFLKKCINFALKKTIFNNSLNNYVISEIDDYIDYLENTNYYIFDRAFDTQKNYFNFMIDYIKQFEDVIKHYKK